MRNCQRLALTDFDDQLLDGLEFCLKAYDFFDQTKLKQGGIARLRLRSSTAEKRLVEEILPIARYVQERYRVGRRIKVRWKNGSQPFDAILWSSGELIKRGHFPRRTTLEVTTSVHERDYLSR